MSEEQILPEFGMPCRESQIASLQDKLAQSEAEMERLQGHFSFAAYVIESYEAVATRDAGEIYGLRTELARERERHQDLRQVVKQYRDSSMDHKELCWKSYGYGKTDIRCDLCVKADALLAAKVPAPVATGETE